MNLKLQLKILSFSAVLSVGKLAHYPGLVYVRHLKI